MSKMYTSLAGWQQQLPAHLQTATGSSLSNWILACFVIVIFSLTTLALVLHFFSFQILLHLEGNSLLTCLAHQMGMYNILTSVATITLTVLLANDYFRIYQTENILSTILFVCVASIFSHFAVQANLIIYSSVYDLSMKMDCQKLIKVLSDFKYGFIILCWLLAFAMTFWNFSFAIKNRTYRKINVVPIIYGFVFIALIVGYLKSVGMATHKSEQAINEKTVFPNFTLLCYFTGVSLVFIAADVYSQHYGQPYVSNSLFVLLLQHIPSILIMPLVFCISNFYIVRSLEN